MPYTSRNRNALLSLVFVTLLATTACSGPAPASDVSATAQSAPAASSTPSPTEPQPQNQAVYDETVELLEEQGVRVGELVEHVNGAYPGVVVTADHEIVSDPDITSAELPKGWTEVDRVAAALYGMNFALASFVNNVTNDLEDTPEELRQGYNDRVLENVVGTAQEATEKRVKEEGWAFMSQGTPLRLAEGIRESGYDGVYDGLTPRVRTIASRACGVQPWEGGMYYEMELDMDLNTVSGEGKPMIEPTRMIAGFTAVKDADGGYRIGGLNFQYGLEGEEKTAEKMAKALDVELGEAQGIGSGGVSEWYCDWSED
jgi:hypothetical protein